MIEGDRRTDQHTTCPVCLILINFGAILSIGLLQKISSMSTFNTEKLYLLSAMNFTSLVFVKILYYFPPISKFRGKTAVTTSTGCSFDAILNDVITKLAIAAGALVCLQKRLPMANFVGRHWYHWYTNGNFVYQW